MTAEPLFTEYGESLMPYSTEHPDHANAMLSSCIGKHTPCDISSGWVDYKVVSESHAALVCRNCALRFVIPRSVDTFGKLKAYCAQKLLADTLALFR